MLTEADAGRPQRAMVSVAIQKNLHVYYLRPMQSNMKIGFLSNDILMNLIY